MLIKYFLGGNKMKFLQYISLLLLCYSTALLPMEQGSSFKEKELGNENQEQQSTQNPFEILSDEIVLQIILQAFDKPEELQQTYDAIVSADKRFNRLAKDPTVFNKRKVLFQQLMNENKNTWPDFENKHLLTAVQYNLLKIIKAELKKNPEFIKEHALVNRASKYGKSEVMEYLCSCNPELANTTLHTHLRTPLHTAIENHNKDAVVVLLKHGAHVNSRTPGKRGLKLYKDFTPLHLAAFKQNLEIMQLLFDNWADFSITDRQGNTPYKYLNPENKGQYLKMTKEQYKKKGKILLLGAQAVEEWKNKFFCYDFLQTIAQQRNQTTYEQVQLQEAIQQELNTKYVNNSKDKQ